MFDDILKNTEEEETVERDSLVLVLIINSRISEEIQSLELKFDYLEETLQNGKIWKLESVYFMKMECKLRLITNNTKQLYYITTIKYIMMKMKIFAIVFLNQNQQIVP